MLSPLLVTIVDMRNCAPHFVIRISPDTPKGIAGQGGHKHLFWFLNDNIWIFGLIYPLIMLSDGTDTSVLFKMYFLTDNIPMYLVVIGT